MPEPRTTVRARVSIAGALVPGEVRAGPLRRHLDVIEVREGGGGPTRHVAGAATVEPLTLVRVLDADRTFEQWAGAPAGEAREVVVEVVGPDGATASFRLAGCWPSAYEALPVVPARGARRRDVVETLTLQVRGWVRET